MEKNKAICASGTQHEVSSREELHSGELCRSVPASFSRRPGYGGVVGAQGPGEYVYGGVG